MKAAILEWAVGCGSAVRREACSVLDILDLIGKADILLGTAHLSPSEIALLRRILVNHPEIEFSISASSLGESPAPDPLLCT